DCRQSQVLDCLLNADKPPEFASVEVIHIPTAKIVEALPTNRRRPLEWILTDVDHRRHVRRNFRTRPALRLQIELVLEVIDADCAKMRTAKVEELVAGGRRLALQQ